MLRNLKIQKDWGEFGGFKHPNALKYEVALNIANGAKCSIGDQMHPEGFLDKATYELIGAAYSEVEKVEEYCDDVESVADIAIFCDKKTFRSNMPSGGVVTLMKQPQNNRYINHLLYASPVKRGGGIEVIEDLIPLYNIKSELKISDKIKKIYDGKTKEEIEFIQNNGKIEFTVSEINCHKVVVLDY